MKVLVVGGLGYLGPVIGAKLRHMLEIERLDTVDIGWFKKCNIYPTQRVFDEIVYADKRDIEVKYLKNYDTVIDLAAVSNDPMGNYFEAATRQINKEAAISLAEKSKSAGVKRFIFASSCSIYGAAGDSPRSESDAKDPLTAYAASKWEAEQGLSRIADADMSVSALRFATACGWCSNFRADLVLNDFVLTAMIDKKIAVLSDGTPWRPLIHVQDIGRAVAWACQIPHEKYTAYNVGSDEWSFSIRELAERVSDLLGVQYEIRGESVSDRRSYRVSFDKFGAVASGWLPEKDLRSTVFEIKEQMEPHLAKYSSFRSSSLIRMNVLRDQLSQGKLDTLLRQVRDCD